MWILWTRDTDTRMDFVEIGGAIQGRLHNGKHPDLAIVTLDEIDSFAKMRGSTGLGDYRDYINTVECCLAEEGEIVQIDEYYQFAMYPPSSDFKENQR